VRVRLRVDGDDPDVLRSLRGWLQEDDAVGAHGDVTWSPDGAPDQMGIVMDVLTLVLGTGLSAAQLVLAVAQWRQSRHPAPVVTIIRPDGVTVRIGASSAEPLEEVARTLEEK
jgi:hypothetical protein